jgi:hypothetical protein
MSHDFPQPVNVPVRAAIPTPNAEHEAALITEPVAYAGRRIHFARNLLFLI